MAARRRPLLLRDLPPDVIERIVAQLAQDVRDLAAANAASRVFRVAPPGRRSAIESALRARVQARGHTLALPPQLPARACTWVEELFARERVYVLARLHASAAVTAGDDAGEFSAFVDHAGGVHTCGACMRVETSHRHPSARWPWPLPAVGHGMFTERRVQYVPTRVASLSSVRVSAVAAGLTHLLALSEAGAVYGCGDNSHGQLGVGGFDTRWVFAPCRACDGELVVGIAAGPCAHHSLAITAAGCAYSWGRNHHGQLGHGDTARRPEPTRIEALDGVRVGGASAGRAHTLFLTASGVVYACGEAGFGQRGHVYCEQQSTPRRIEALAGVRVRHVCAGAQCSLVVDAGGGVHITGSLDGGRRGWHPVPTRLNALGQAGVHAVRTSACPGSAAVLGVDGSVHTFGSNHDGQLGLGLARHNVPAPTRVDALRRERVVECSVGGAHALFVTADGGVHTCGQYSPALGLGFARVPARGSEPPPPGPVTAVDLDTGLCTPARLAQLPPLASLTMRMEPW